MHIYFGKNLTIFIWHVQHFIHGLWDIHPVLCYDCLLNKNKVGVMCYIKHSFNWLVDLFLSNKQIISLNFTTKSTKKETVHHCFTKRQLLCLEKPSHEKNSDSLSKPIMQFLSCLWLVWVFQNIKIPSSHAFIPSYFSN